MGADQKIRAHLVLKSVEVEHLKQFNELLKYVFQVTKQDIEESGYEEDGELVRAKRPVLQRSDVLGWFDDDKLVSQICIYPCLVNIHGRVFEMAGVTGVGTYPEYSSMGLMHDLVKEALQMMRDNGQWISYLYPYIIPYYRRKGWEIISEHMTFTVKDSQLPKPQDLPGHVKRQPIDHKDVIRVYDQFARVNHAAMIREELDWEEYWRWENEDERTAAIYYAENEEPMGYMFYWIEEDVFHVKEMVYLNQEARLGLWNFIVAHYSMIDEVKGNIYKNEPVAFLMEDSQITETIEPFFMGRIVDVEAFLNEYPFIGKCDPFHFIVTDPIASWNNGAFSVEWDGNDLKIGRKQTGPSVEVSIGTLTSLLMSFRSPAYFYEIERMKTDALTLKQLEKIIPTQRPYFSDYF